ncbi:MAG: cobamide remodeling phosphodiesterase CbiR [Planctomycetota bacterium]
MPLPCLANRLPYRLGTTSYIVPADILPNVRHLAGVVDDISLILFESAGASNLPSAQTVQMLDALQRDGGPGYSVHLPLDCPFGDRDPDVRTAALERALRVWRLTAPCAPRAWVLHLPGDHRGDPPAADIDRWQADSEQTLAAFLAAGPPPHQVAIETLDYDFALVAELVEGHDTAVCIDVGHLLLRGEDPLAACERWIDRLLVVHLHGIVDGRDHHSAAHLDPDLLTGLHAICRDAPRPVICTLEVFAEDHLHSSLAALAAAAGLETDP